VELLLTISALRRSSAKSINVVIPYYGYARQDRKMSPRVPISAAEIAKLIEAMGADRVMCVDLHSGQEQGFFKIPVDNLEAQNVAVKYFIKKIKKSTLINDQFVILSPDAGGVSRAKSF
jgi:ribose-phosphate pyrophosphokinase